MPIPRVIRPVTTKSASRAYSTTVTRIEQLTPHFVRVTFFSEEFANLGPCGADQRIKVIFPLPGSRVSELPLGDDWYTTWRMIPHESRNPMRTYTVRSADRERRELVVDFVAHGDAGPASRWIAQAVLGDTVQLVAPNSRAEVPPNGFEWHPGLATTILIVGDETAVPAVCSIVESLNADAVGVIFLEIPTAADRLPVNAPRGVKVTWLARDSRTNVGHGVLLDETVRAWADVWVAGQAQPASAPTSALTNDDELLDSSSDILWDVPPEPHDEGLYAWLAGEAGTITGLRRHLVRTLGIDRKRVTFMGYWKIGKSEN